MRVPYIVVISGDQRYSRETACVKGDVSFCCDDMESEWGWGGFVDFDGDWRTAEHAVYLGREDSVCDLTAKFCPWCGAPIELQEVERRDERVKVCGVNLKSSLWTDYCQNKPRPGSERCGRHQGKPDVVA